MGRHSLWKETRRQEILCHVTMSIFSCISVVGIKFDMVVPKKKNLSMVEK